MKGVLMSKFKLIDKDTVLPKLRPLNWDVYINGKPYYVVRIDGFIHTIGGKYGENEFWAYPRGEEPAYENLIEFNCDNPISWGITYQPRNYSKCKWGECEAMSGGTIKITRNGKDFYTLMAKGINYGIDLARVLIVRLQEHPIDFNEIDFDKKVIGRKVFYRGVPMIVTRYVDGQACVILEPDEGCKLEVPPEFADEEGMEGYYEDNSAKVEVFSEQIWWFRD